MKKQRSYFIPALLISILFGIALPLIMGLKDFRLIASLFTLVWLIYAVGLFVHTFLVRPVLTIKVVQRKNPTIVKYEFRDSSKEKR